MAYTKREVEYRRAAPGDSRCSDCLNFIEPRGRCTQVSGVIDPDYVCELWEPGKYFPAPVGSYGRRSPHRNGS